MRRLFKYEMYDLLGICDISSDCSSKIGAHVYKMNRFIDFYFLYNLNKSYYMYAIFVYNIK